MQFSVLPTAPHHYRCTPGVLSPILTSLVSSKVPTACGPECLQGRLELAELRDLHVRPSVNRLIDSSEPDLRGREPPRPDSRLMIFWGPPFSAVSSGHSSDALGQCPL